MNPSKRSRAANCGRPTSDAAPSAVQPGGSNGLLDDDQLRRWAELVAAGEATMPDLPASETVAYTLKVQQLRHQRLVRFIAHCIALDIRREVNEGSQG